jgi:hypothetical protein
MKCANQACGSPAANEINISVNFSECSESLETEYTGSTEYGDPSPMIGTLCYECGEATYLPNWREVVRNFIDGTVDTNILDMRQNFHDAYGKDHFAALHAAYDLITYLEQKGDI